jgi:hypothetical protein
MALVPRSIPVLGLVAKKLTIKEQKIWIMLPNPLLKLVDSLGLA